MQREELHILHLPAALLRGSTTVLHLLAEALGVSRTAAAERYWPFELKNDERRFVLTLLSRKPNLWVFRTHQQRFCGDFLVVDMSSPRPERRRVYALDLKQGAALRVGGGGAGVQFRNVEAALRQLARSTGIVAAESAPELLCGDAEELLRFLGARAGGSRGRPLVDWPG